jgi:hypothetical protein
MDSSKEVVIGSLLIIFVLGATAASVLWGDPVALPPQDNLRPPLTLAEPLTQPAPMQANHQLWRDAFPKAYVIITVILVIFAGLICVINCFRQLVPFEKILNKFPKIKRMNFT